MFQLQDACIAEKDNVNETVNYTKGRWRSIHLPLTIQYMYSCYSSAGTTVETSNCNTTPSPSSISSIFEVRVYVGICFPPLPKGQCNIAPYMGPLTWAAAPLTCPLHVYPYTLLLPDCLALPFIGWAASATHNLSTSARSMPWRRDTPSGDARRACSQCRQVHSFEEFSKNQWAKGAGISRCSWCVNGQTPPLSSAPPPAARENESSQAQFDSLAPFAMGSFRLCAKGRYTDGRRRGKPCVAKWFKPGLAHLEETYFRDDIKSVEQTVRIIEQWNSFHQGEIKPIQVNKPEIKTWASGPHKGKKFLLEPYIDRWQKWNSNTGYTSGNDGWDGVMQAVSHFSYHQSSGQRVLCDLQGGQTAAGPVISDPVIMSAHQQFGVTDLGPKGIRNFSAYHRCNKYCKPHWNKPRDAAKFYEPVESSTMEERRVVGRVGYAVSAFASVQEDYDSDYSDW